MDFSSGYVQRGISRFPRQGERTPWKLHQNYALDLMSLRYAKLTDGVLEFSNPVKAAESWCAPCKPKTMPINSEMRETIGMESTPASTICRMALPHLICRPLNGATNVQ